MTLILPGGDAPERRGSRAAPAVAAVDDAGAPLVAAGPDFGARLVRPTAAVSRAADLARTDGALADATRELAAFGNRLTAGDGAVETWPERFATETRRLRDAYASGIPDGPARDRFDSGFDLFARAKAVETRRIAAHRVVANNRAALTRLLDGYAETAAQSGDPVTTDFARREGEAAIRNQQDAQVLTEEEAARLTETWRADLAARQARQVVRDDPGAALGELKTPDGGQFAGLSAEARAALRDEADRRVAATAETAASERTRAEVSDRTAAVHRTQTFESEFATALAEGRAAALTIEDGVSAGVIDETVAARLRQALADDDRSRRRRAEQARAVAERLARGRALDPGDPGDLSAADAWLSVALGGDGDAAGLPSLLGSGDAEIGPRLRHATTQLGFVPPAAARVLDLFWRSGEPRLMGVAAAAETRSGSDRAAYRDLVAAGLTPEDAAQRISVLRDAGAFVADTPSALPEMLARKLSDPASRALLRTRLLDALQEEAARVGMTAGEFLSRAQAIREALPADSARGPQVAFAPALVVGGMLVAPETAATALTALGLGGLLLSLKGDTQNSENTNKGSNSFRVEEGGDGGDAAGADDNGDTSSPKARQPRRNGRKASDNSKNERHGDGGRARRKVDAQIEKLKEKAKAAPKKERKKLKKKARAVEQNAQKRKSGNEHSRIGKGRKR